MVQQKKIPLPDNPTRDVMQAWCTGFLRKNYDGLVALAALAANKRVKINVQHADKKPNARYNNKASSKPSKRMSDVNPMQTPSAKSNEHKNRMVRSHSNPVRTP